MTTTTLDKSEAAARSEEADAQEISAALTAKARTRQEKKEARANRETGVSKLRMVLSKLTPAKSQDGLPLILWSAFFRSIVLIGFYLMAAVTAQGIIPSLGLWLHRESGAAQGALTTDGTIAMWLLPLLFMTALLFAGELVVMRTMWRWSSRMIEKIRDARTEASEEPVAKATTTRTTRQSKKNRKRSK